MTKRASRGYLLPDVVDPPRTCVKVMIPNDDKHMLAFWGALETLGHPYSWQNDDGLTAIDVAQVWRDVWLDARASFLFQDCGAQKSCRTLLPRSGSISYYPCSPFAETCELPAGYTYAPFTVVNANIITQIIGEWGLGYQQGDVYTDLTKLPQGSWSNILDGWRFFPRITINTPAGDGLVRIEFLNIPQGARALVVVDDDFDLLHLRLIELNKDLVSIPPETAVPITYDVEVAGEGTHIVEIAFIPVVDDTPLPIFFGGGLRKVELCGFSIGGEEVTENCCSETNSLLSANNAILSKILALIGDGFKIVPISGLEPADELAGGCSPFQFDAAPGDEGDDIQRRKDALCFVTRVYVLACVVNALPPFIREGLGIDALFEGVPAQINQIRAYATNIEVLFNVIIALLTDGVTLNAVACEMISKLQGKVNSRAAFEASVAKIVDAGLALLTANNMVVRANQDPQNYKLFNELLVAVMDDTTLELVDVCDFCSDELIVAEDCGNVSLVDVENTGCTFEYLGDCLWRITQPNVTADNRRWYSFADANGLFLYVNYPDAPYETPHVAGCEVGGICGDADYHGLNYGGGFVPGRLSKVLWWNQSEYSPSAVLKVEAYSCP